MTTLQMLTVRTNAALARLATLQRRAERISAAANGVVRPALKELTDALEELQVANDELETRVLELTAARTSASEAQQRFEEFLEITPFSCLWTDSSGEILEANSAAGRLLNVSRQHLAGRPFMLFLTDRTTILDAFRSLAAGATRTVEFDAEIRPRERRVRAVHVTGARLELDDRLCWFVVESRCAETMVPASMTE